jgi:hypothetical protein
MIFPSGIVQCFLLTFEEVSEDPNYYEVKPHCNSNTGKDNQNRYQPLIRCHISDQS